MPAKTEDDPLLTKTVGLSKGKKIAALYGMRSSVEDCEDQRLKFCIQPETFRFYAYIFFWSMSIMAILITKFVTKQRLLQGPASGEPSCPPFQSGVGFNIETDSHLMKAFGFNNASAKQKSRK